MWQGLKKGCAGDVLLLYPSGASVDISRIVLYQCCLCELTGSGGLLDISLILEPEEEVCEQSAPSRQLTRGQAVAISWLCGPSQILSLSLAGCVAV